MRVWQRTCLMAGSSELNSGTNWYLPTEFELTNDDEDDELDAELSGGCESSSSASCGAVDV